MPRRARGAASAAAVLLAVVAATGACSSDKASPEELCTALRANPGVASTFTGFDPSDPRRALEQLRSARVTLGELRDAAPGEVRDDLDVEIDYVQALIEAVQQVEDGDANAAVEAVRQVTAAHPKVGDAAAALASYSREHCGS